MIDDRRSPALTELREREQDMVPRDVKEVEIFTEVTNEKVASDSKLRVGGYKGRLCKSQMPGLGRRKESINHRVNSLLKSRMTREMALP